MFFKRSFFIPIFTLLFLVHCKTVPLTGRKGIKIYPSSEVNAMSFQQYDQVIAEAQLSSNKQQVDMINRVGKRIQKAVEQYMQENGHSELLIGYQWEYNLIESPEANAWCMPGGKVAFYTGILPICENEEGVAVVMGHEIAHAIAEHGNERMSHQMLQQYGGAALDVFSREHPEETRALAFTAFGLGTQYGVLLPFSRKHESEADEMGLYFMAMAGYNPESAPKFWQRMSAMSGASPPEFMSTHPSHSTRVNDLNANMPKAKEYYQKAKK